MPLGGRMAYDDELSPVGLTQGDLADTVYQGADPTLLDEGGCDCPCPGAREIPLPPEEAPMEPPTDTMGALFGEF